LGRDLNVKTIVTAALVVLLIGAAIVGQGWAHETKVVGGKFRVIVGFAREPAFTTERNGLDLIIRRHSDASPVENMERSVSAILISPDGRTARPLKIRPQFGRPGYYTDDFIMTQPGVYKLRIFGAIEDVQFNEMFESHEVRRLEELRFP
jgi:hypothetical protein